MLTPDFIFNRVFTLAQQGLGFMGPSPLWAVVLADEQSIIAEEACLKYGSLSPLIKLQNRDFKQTRYSIFSNLLFEQAELGELRPQKFFYCNNLATQDREKVLIQFKDAGIDVVEMLSAEGEKLNESFFYYEKCKLPYSKKIYHSPVINTALRIGFDCVVFDKHIVERSDDDFRAQNNRTPLRVLKCPLQELNFSWKILTDDYRRNTLVLSEAQDIARNQEIVRTLEQKGVALLAMSALDDQEVLKALSRLRFISVLFEI